MLKVRCKNRWEVQLDAATGALLSSEARRSDVEATWIDWVAEPSDLADLYRTSRVVVCASTCEGGPRFTVEAMACGLPAVSTRVGIMPDLLEDGAAGRLVGWSAEDLARGLGEVLADEDARRTMGQVAHQRVQQFEADAAIERYARGLQALAAEPASGR